MNSREKEKRPTVELKAKMERKVEIWNEEGLGWEVHVLSLTDRWDLDLDLN